VSGPSTSARSGIRGVVRPLRFGGEAHGRIEEVRVTSNGGRQVVLDDVSRAIIEQLQQDGRRSYARIASAVGLSEAAVRQRVQRLLDAGVMQIVAVTDPMQVGFPRQAMVGVRAKGDARATADQLAGMREVDYVVVTAGSFDVILEIVCEDDDRLLDTVARIRSVEGVESTETFVYLGLRKQTYAWGTRRSDRAADLHDGA
jgi:Lrp/AsnC family transcriptional regulator, regulator for asnA, asnC and gidA